MKLRIAVIAAVLTAGVAPQARAWDELGHRVVARIAWDHLTPAARQRASALLMAAPPNAGLRELLATDTRPLEVRQREWFVMASYWPDLIRSERHPGYRFAHSDWHYVNHFWEVRPDGSVRDRPDLPMAGELLTQVGRIHGELGNPAVPDSLQAVNLAWLLHLVGDAHQPLHNSARITPQDTAGDRGGNLFRLLGIYPYNNLHAVWDALMGPAFPWVQPGDRDEAEYIGRIAATIGRRWPQSRARLLADDPLAWSREGLGVAKNSAYPGWLVRDQRLPWRYNAYAWRTVESRVALAGYRLAEILNRRLGSAPGD